jgi:hypothetical protein
MSGAMPGSEFENSLTSNNDYPARVMRFCQLIPIPIHNVPDETDGFFRLARA